MYVWTETRFKCDEKPCDLHRSLIAKRILKPRSNRSEHPPKPIRWKSFHSFKRSVTWNGCWSYRDMNPTEIILARRWLFRRVSKKHMSYWKVLFVVWLRSVKTTTIFFACLDLLKQTLDLHPDSTIIHIGCDEVRLRNAHQKCRSTAFSISEQYVRYARRELNVPSRYPFMSLQACSTCCRHRSENSTRHSNTHLGWYSPRRRDYQRWKTGKLAWRIADGLNNSQVVKRAWRGFALAQSTERSGGTCFMELQSEVWRTIQIFSGLESVFEALQQCLGGKCFQGWSASVLDDYRYCTSCLEQSSVASFHGIA